ncbi:peptidase [Halobacteriales archaeon QS_3_64_16]|nr:MAG: peptidase [Halobacteriales archaeon QS_3_64_16]
MNRRDRLDSLLATRDLEAVWFARPNSFTWLTGGSNVVDREASVGIAAAGYDGESISVLTNSIEADRLGDEQLPAEIEISTFPWYESSLAAALADRSPQPAAADVEVPGFEGVDPGALRQPLTDADIGRYRDLGTDTAAVLEAACRDCRETTTERALAASLRGEFARRDITAPVMLVGGAERAPKYRHFPPTDAVLGDYALVSVTAEREGLHASCTRTVAFDSPDWLPDRHDAARTVDATALDATRTVASRENRAGAAGEVFEAIREAYDAVGWPGEWEHHHQGGAAGYAGREWIATPESEKSVALPMAYAWNPTVEGAKSEDTALVTEGGIEILTATGDWPRTEVEPPEGDGAIARHDVLYR